MAFRSSLKKVFWLFVFTLALIIIVLYRWHLNEFHLNNLYRFLISAALPISILLRAFLWLFPALYSKFSIYDNRVLRTFNNKQEDYIFQDIRHLHFSIISARFSGGYIIDFKNGRRLRITSFLSNSDVLLEKIYRSRPDLVSKNDMDKYRLKYNNVGASWQRLGLKLKNIPRLILHLIAIPSLFAYFAKNNTALINVNESLAFQLHFILAYLFLFISNSLEDFLIFHTENLFAKSTNFYKTLDYFTSILFYIACLSYLIFTNSLPLISR